MIDVRAIFKNTSRGNLTRTPHFRGTIAFWTCFCNSKRYVDPEASSSREFGANPIHYVSFGKRDWDGDHLGFAYILDESEVDAFTFLKGEK